MKLLQFHIAADALSISAVHLASGDALCTAKTQIQKLGKLREPWIYIKKMIFFIC